MSATAYMPTDRRYYKPGYVPRMASFNWYLVPDLVRYRRQNDWLGGMVTANISLPLFLALGLLAKTMLKRCDSA